MEIVYTTKLNENFQENNIIGFYGDVLDLLKMNITVDGLTYDDGWTVKRFLNGLKLRLSPRINSILKYLGLDNNILNVKLNRLSNTEFKFVLLAKLLLNNKNIIIFDYFEVGLSNKDQKRLIKIIRELKRDGKTIIIISKNLVFLNMIIDYIIVTSDDEIVFNGSINDLIKLDLVRDPEIIKFINMANRKNAKLEYTLDASELMKDIYRSVC